MLMKKHIAQSEGYRYLPLDDTQNYYSLKDIDVATTLICKNFELIDALPTGERQGECTFVFKNEKGLQEMVDGFWSNRIEVHPLEFANARKNLKSRIYGMRKNY